jgi:hypothetical protein
MENIIIKEHMNQRKYKGEWKEGLRHGKGSM